MQEEYPMELTGMTEVSYVCSLQYGTHQPYVATEHLKGG